MKTWVVVVAALGAILAHTGAAARDGKVIYAQNCARCHTNGVAGARKAEDKAALTQRSAQGREALLTTVLRGKGAMPPKGGNASLTDAEAKAAVDHMLNASR